MVQQKVICLTCFVRHGGLGLQQPELNEYMLTFMFLGRGMSAVTCMGCSLPCNTSAVERQRQLALYTSRQYLTLIVWLGVQAEM